MVQPFLNSKMFWVKQASWLFVLAISFALTVGVVLAQVSSFDSFLEDVKFMYNQPDVDAFLFFTPFQNAGNPDPTFSKHWMSIQQMQQICQITNNCEKVGINPGTVFGGANYSVVNAFPYKYLLEIASANDPGAVSRVINQQSQAVIVRIGIADGGIGFTGWQNPDQYVEYLKKVDAATDKEFFAIAGPNEPDIESKWFSPECGSAPGTPTPQSEEFYNCVGPKLASFMNKVCDAKNNGELGGVKLLTPAFNMTSYTFTGIFDSMVKNGAKMSDGCISGMAGNIYPNGQTIRKFWADQKVSEKAASIGKKIYITETGIMDGGTLSQVEIPREQYYIQPINGLNGADIGDTGLGTGTNKTDKIREDLIMQGYEPRCASKGFAIQLTEEGRGAMEKLLRQPIPPAPYNGVILGYGNGSPGGTTDGTSTIYSRLDVDYDDVLIPIFRDLDRSNPNLKRSLEDYFGFKETGDNMYLSSEMKTAAINSLLSNEQRCAVAYQNLLARDTMCKKLADPNACSLYATKIPNASDYTTRSLLNELETYRNGRDVMNYCRELVAQTNGDMGRLRQGILNAPLTIDDAYRLAFLVTSVRLRAPNPSKFTNLFVHPNTGWLAPPKPKHNVIVVAFKIPDVTTNKGFNDGKTADTAYADPATLTKNVLIPLDQQKQYEQQAKQRRQELLEKAREILPMAPDDSWQEINCMGLGAGGDGGGVGGYACKYDPLSAALVQIINAQSKLFADAAQNNSALGDLIGPLTDEEATLFQDDGEYSCFSRYEKATTINDPGALTDPGNPTHVFNDTFGKALLSGLFDDCTHDSTVFGNSPSSASTGQPDFLNGCPEDWYLKSRFYVTPGQLAAHNQDEDELDVKQYLVYPEGYELRTIEGVLAGSFFSRQQLQSILEQQKKNPSDIQRIVDNIALEEGSASFTGGSDSYTYTSRLDEDCKTVQLPDGSNREVCQDQTFSVRLVSTSPQTSAILGGTLGYWIRKAQLSLNATTQKSWGYLSKCASIEEFLTDTCGGGTAFSPNGQSRNPTGDTSWRGSSCKSNTPLDSFGYNDKSTLPTTGRATFYGQGVFNGTLNTRKAMNDFRGNVTVHDCEYTGTYDQVRAEAKALAERTEANNPGVDDPEFVGCVALLRTGDLYFRDAFNKGNYEPNNVRGIWLKATKSDGTSVVHGPFAVMDVAASHHAACLYDEGWAVDIDYNSFYRLLGQNNDVGRVTVCDTWQNC